MRTPWDDFRRAEAKDMSVGKYDGSPIILVTTPKGWVFRQSNPNLHPVSKGEAERLCEFLKDSLALGGALNRSGWTLSGVVSGTEAAREQEDMLMRLASGLSGDLANMPAANARGLKC